MRVFRGQYRRRSQVCGDGIRNHEPFAISGFLAPVITGSVLKLHGSFVDAFWLMAGLSFSSVIVVLNFHHPDRDRPKPMLEL